MKKLIIILALLPSLALALPTVSSLQGEPQHRDGYVQALNNTLTVTARLEKAGYTKKQIIEIIKAHNVKPNKQ